MIIDLNQSLIRKRKYNSLGKMKRIGSCKIIYCMCINKPKCILLNIKILDFE